MGDETTVATNSFNMSAVLDSDEGLAALHLFGDYSDELLDFAAISCIIFMIIGIPGNLITIISLARYKKIQNATAIFIINLSCADLLFGCINLPLAASTFFTRRWDYGLIMCSFFPFLRFALAGVSMFTVFAITTNRYVLVSHPRFYTKLYTNRNLGIIVASTWIISIGMLIPTWASVWGRFGMDLETSFCVILPDENGNTPMKFLFVCAFVIPFVTITFCYIRIFCIARKSGAKSHGTTHRKRDIEDSSFASSSAEKNTVNDKIPDKEVSLEHPKVQSLRPPSTPRVKISFSTDVRSSTSIGNIFNIGNLNIRKSQLLNRAAPTSKDKRLLTMISAIMITFFIFNLPITVIKVCHEIAISHPTVIIWSYILKYFTTCVNPIIYVVMSHEYRKAYKKVIVMPTCEGKACNCWR